MAQSRERDPMARVLALGHEIGNELAAARLTAHLVATASAPAERTALAAEIEAVAVRAAALVGQLRPLLDRSRGRLAWLPVHALLAGLAHEVRGVARLRRRVDAAVPARAPEVWTDGGALQALLMGLVLDAADAAGEDGRVRVRGRRQVARYTIAVQVVPATSQVGRAPSPLSEVRLALVRAVARGVGATLRVGPATRPPRLELRLRCRAAPRGLARRTPSSRSSSEGASRRTPSSPRGGRR